MPKFTKKVAIGVSVAALVAVGGGTAFAYWTTTGHGSGSATTGTDTSWNVTSAAAQGSALTPGGPTDTVAVTVKNLGSGVQHLNGVAVKIANSDGTDWSVTDCSALDYTVSITPVSGDLAASGTKVTTASITMNETGANQDGCKSLTVPLYFSAS
jgi:hypothetical protein